VNKEFYSRIEDKLDKHTDMLIGIKDDVNREISLIKLAHQRLKYMTVSIAVIMISVMSVEYPKLVRFIKELM